MRKSSYLIPHSKTKRKIKKTRNRKREGFLAIVRRVVFWMVFFFFLGASGWILFFSPLLNVLQVEVVTERLEAEEVKKEIVDEMNQPHWKFIPQNNLLLVYKSHIRDHLQSKFRSIRQVEVDRKFPDTIVVVIDERESQLVWCRKEKCYLVDEKAEAFYELTGEELIAEQENLITVNDDREEDLQLGARVTSEELINFYATTFVNLWDNAQVEIVPQLNVISAMAEEVRVKTKEGWEVYFSTSRSLETQAKILHKVLEERVTDRRNQLEYVDLRIKGKAIYKLKSNDDSEESDNEEETEEEDDE